MVVFCCIISSCVLNLSTNQALAVGRSVTLYLAGTTFILITFGLPYGFLVVLCLVIATTVGKSFDAGSSHSTELALLFPVLYLFLGGMFLWVILVLKWLKFTTLAFSLEWRLDKKKKACYIYFTCIYNWKITLFYHCTLWNCLWLEITSGLQK